MSSPRLLKHALSSARPLSRGVQTPSRAARLATLAQNQPSQRDEPRQPTASTSKLPLGTSSARPHGSNPAMSFPCVDQNELRAHRLRQQRDSKADPAAINLPNLPNPPPKSSEEDGPEPAYANVVSGYQVYHHAQPYALDYGGHLPSFDLAYETWGALNAARDNVVLIHTGLSASSHAHSSAANPSEGWWEKFIGPGKAVDTNKFFVICTNVLGGCYGSTGPSSADPSDGRPYATRFPVLSIFDMVRAQFHLLDSLGIDKLYASVGSSMGGMQSVAAAHLEPERVGRVVSISATARSSPSSIAMRYAQRSVLMADPNWKRGFYYDDLPPHTGMKLARRACTPLPSPSNVFPPLKCSFPLTLYYSSFTEIATITYRSGPEWEQRFGLRRRDISAPIAASTDPSALAPLPSPPVLCPDFLIETYLDHQGEQFCLKYDANSLIYVSKAMDLFDMSADALADLERRKQARDAGVAPEDALCPLPDSSAGPSKAGEAVKPAAADRTPKPKQPAQFISSLPSSHAYLPGLREGLSAHKVPTLVMGVQSDTLFPIEQQRELAECLKANGNDQVIFYELNQPWGHDTFLLDVNNIGRAVKGFLEAEV